MFSAVYHVFDPALAHKNERAISWEIALIYSSDCWLERDLSHYLDHTPGYARTLKSTVDAGRCRAKPGRRLPQWGNPSGQIILWRGEMRMVQQIEEIGSKGELNRSVIAKFFIRPASISNSVAE